MDPLSTSELAVAAPLHAGPATLHLTDEPVGAKTT